VKPRDADRSKNFFALGLVTWMYTRPVDATLQWIAKRFSSTPLVADANTAAFKAGYAFGETAELFDHPYQVAPAHLPPGTYTNINGNTALAWGLVAAGHLARLPVFLGGYPITPASDILHELSKHKNFGIRTLQAEDEIAGIGAALGAAFGGHLAVTTTSGPGVALKSETMGLALNLELPLLIIDIQRGGPSTGLPTKTEAADLLMAMYGRHGESPIPIVAPYSPSHCFATAIEAARIALKYRTPVLLLSDGYLANGSEPWLLPDVESLPDIAIDFAVAPNHTRDDGAETFWPYLRDPVTLARPWAIPGTPGLAHRIGGLEKEDGTGNISYDPDNHQRMVQLRAAKVAGIADDIPPVPVSGDVDDAELLVVGWGSTWGAIDGAMNRVRSKGRRVAHAHLMHLNPFPRNLGEVIRRYPKVLAPEMNLGQLSRLLRAEFLVDVKSVSKVKGTPFTAGELEQAILEELST
jgi:2-oxoglutarate ferredoxin oxidoreductase subunit alpha